MPSDTTTSAQNTPAPSTLEPSQEHSSVDHELYFTRFAMRLLVTLCLGALASFALAPYFLAPHAMTTRSEYVEGICTAQPQTIRYASTSQEAGSVPSLWTKAGKNSRQFALAQACAAAFTVTYETFNINATPSLTSATSMLSSTGKKHFFAGTATESKDTRLDATWQAQARKEHLQQSAQVLNKAQLQTVLVNHGTFSATFITNYQLTTTISGKKSTTQQKHLVVVLAASAVAPSDASTGWQVVDWT